MTSTGSVIYNNAWKEIADNVDYMLQNKDKSSIVWVKASDAEPTDLDGAIELPYQGVISQHLLSGKIWAKAKEAQATVSISK